MTFTGSVVEQFYWKLRDSNSRMENTGKEIIKNYKREIEKIAIPFLTQRRTMLNEYLEKISAMTVDKEKELFVTQSSIIKINDTFLQSAILPERESEKIDFIKESLDYPKKLKLLFTASEHSFKASQFHAVCDSVPHTFTLVET